MRLLRYAITFALLLQGCSNTEDDVKNYLVNGKLFYDKGLFDKSRIEFKNTLQIDQSNEEAYFYLALIDEKKENWPDFFKNLNTVIKLNPNNIDAHIKLSRFYLLNREYNNAHVQVDFVLKLEPLNVDALVQQGTIFFKQDNFENAMHCVDKALSIANSNLDAIILKSAIFMKTRDYNLALQLADENLKLNPNALPIYQLKLEIYSQMNDTDKIEATYDEILKRFPQSVELLLPLAKHFSNTGQDEKALATLKKLVQLQPNNFQAKLALLDYLVASLPLEFNDYINEFLKNNPDSAELYFRLAEFNVKEGKYDDASKALNWIVLHKAGSREALAAKTALASIAVQLNHIDEGSKLIDEVLKIDSRNYQAMFLKATINFLHSNYDDAIAQLRDIIRDFPNSDEALVLLAKIYTKKSSPELAVENFRKAIDLNPSNFDAVLPVVTSLINREELDRAEDILQKALKMNAKHPSILQAMAQVKLLKKDWVGSEQIAKEIANKIDGEGYAHYLRGKIFESQGIYNEAIDNYEKALAITPSLIDALNSLVHCYVILGQFDKMHHFIDIYIKNNPNAWQAIILKAEAYSLQKKTAQSITLLQSAIAHWPTVHNLYEALANVYASQNSFSKIIETYTNALKIIPDNTQIRLMLASVYERINKFDSALEQYNILTNQATHDTLIDNNLASLLLDHFETPDNIQRALQLTSNFKSSSNPYFLDTYGWALLKAGKLEESINIFKHVIVIAHDVAVFHYHLGYAYFKLNDRLSAINELKEAISITKRDGNYPEMEAYSQFLQIVNQPN